MTSHLYHRPALQAAPVVCVCVRVRVRVRVCARAHARARARVCVCVCSQTRGIINKDLPEAWKLVISKKIENNLFSKEPCLLAIYIYIYQHYLYACHNFYAYMYLIVR